MCGILGVFGKRTNLEEGLCVMSHRGDDESGIENLRENLSTGTFGHNRLAIIDLDNGTQPMTIGDLTIVFNGEIYNYKELREELKKEGYKFLTNSDTEVILRAYACWGTNCVKKFIGTWAFAIHDIEYNDKIFLSRDRIGEKPLYYHFENGVLSFASELPALLKIIKVKKKICKEAVGLFFSHHIRHIPYNLTIYEGIYKLPPAHNLVFDRKNVELERYWSPDFKKNGKPGSYPLVLSLAVNRTCVSDVPIGLLLSGGVDSTNIAIAIYGKDITTYTIGFDKNDPELARAKKVADELGLKNKQIIFSKKKYINNGLKIFKKLIKQLGEPIDLIQPVFTYMIAKEVRKDGIKVLIGGNGADELFYGYNSAQISKFLGYMPNYKPFLYSKWSKIPKEIDKLCNSKEFIDRSQWMGLALENEHSITIVNDLGGMAATVEIRTPFLDKEMIEYAHSLPTKYKVKAFGENKIIMRDYIRDELGESFVYKDKIGFGQNINLAELIRHQWKREIKRGFDYVKKIKGLNFNGIDYIWNQHMMGKDNSKIIFGLYAFAVWHKECFK